MKRVLTIIFLLTIVSSAFSQVDYKKPIFESNSKRDLETLKTIVIIEPSQEQAILDFFTRKQKQYTVYTITPEYRKQILINYEAELKSLIDPSEVSKLDKNRKILIELISDK